MRRVRRIMVIVRDTTGEKKIRKIKVMSVRGEGENCEKGEKDKGDSVRGEGEKGGKGEKDKGDSVRGEGEKCGKVRRKEVIV